MSVIVIVLHVIVCIALIMIVLLQTGKGADMGAAFGGGSSQTLFGSTGAGSFLGKATTVAAVIFMLTSLTLAYMSSSQTSTSLMDDATAPIEQSATTDESRGDNPDAAAPASTAAEKPADDTAPAAPSDSE
jgi:preprotein translocase subunit SecG